MQISAVCTPGIKSENLDILQDMISVTGGTVLNVEGDITVFEAEVQHMGLIDSFEVHKDYFVVGKKEDKLGIRASSTRKKQRKYEG